MQQILHFYAKIYEYLYFNIYFDNFLFLYFLKLKIKDVASETQHLAPPGDSVFFHEALRTEN